MLLSEIRIRSSTTQPEFWDPQIGCIPMWHTDLNQSVNLSINESISQSVNQLPDHRIDSFHSNLFTTMSKTKELSKDVSD